MTRESPNAPLEDRLAFFRAQSAAVAFNMAREAARYMLKHNLTRNHPIHDPLVISILVLYARPFKQRPPLRLSPDFITSTRRTFHDLLITIRDKIAVHSDLDEPITVYGGPINELAGHTANGNTYFGVTIIVPDLAQTLALLDYVHTSVDSEVRAIWNKYFKKARVADGVTIVNLAPGVAPFLVSHPNLGTGAVPPMALPSDS
jgi:hypothetical protein